MQGIRQSVNEHPNAELTFIYKNQIKKFSIHVGVKKIGPKNSSVQEYINNVFNT